MKSNKSMLFLPPVFAAAVVFCVPLSTFGQGVSVMPDSAYPCFNVSSTNIIGTYMEGYSWDTSITLTNTSKTAIDIRETIVTISGDSGIFESEAPPQPFGINPGDTFYIPVHISFTCPPTKPVYSGVFGFSSLSGNPCSLGTFTFHVLFPVTDTITLDVPTSVYMFNLTPHSRWTTHLIKIRNNEGQAIRLKSLQITDTSKILFFSQEGNKTFSLNDTLLPANTNTKASVTLDIIDTGSYEFGLQLNFSDGTLPELYPAIVSVKSKLSDNYVPLYAASFDTLNLNNQLCHRAYAKNTTPNIIQITQIILTDASSGKWSLDNLPTLPDTLSPGNVQILGNVCALAEDSIPLTANLKIIYTYPCGTDSSTFPLHGEIKPASPAGVSESLPQSTGFTINPNPSHSEITISLPLGNNSTVEIYDVLGNLVLRKVASGEFVWDGGWQNSVPNGAYIVRVTERGADGASIVSSKRLLFVR